MEASIRMVFQVCFLGTQKVAIGSCMCFQASCGEMLLASEGIVRSRFATEICIMANGIGFGPV